MARPVIVGIGEVLWDMLPAGKQLGGAPANFAFHAGQLGAEALIVSRVGDDEPGREILRRLDSLGVGRQHVGVDPRHPTGTVDVRVDAAGVPEYVIHAPVAWDFLESGPELLRLAARSDAVCLGTLAQRSPASRAAVSSFLGATPPQCLRVFDINLRQAFYSRDLLHELLGRSDVLKLNDGELAVVAQLFSLNSAEPTPAARELMARYPLRLVALTRGGHGSLLLTRDGRASDYPGVPVEKIADTVGAGDAFTAALVMGLLAGKGLDQINDRANRLAAFVCTQHGATPRHPPALT
jgi:fructokinase